MSRNMEEDSPRGIMRKNHGGEVTRWHLDGIIMKAELRRRNHG